MYDWQFTLPDGNKGLIDAEEMGDTTVWHAIITSDPGDWEGTHGWGGTAAEPLVFALNKREESIT
jgi:hypothetical protein